MLFTNRHKQDAEAVIVEQKAKFIEGSIMNHVISMSLLASVGIVAIFFVELVDFYFISLLGEINLAAAIGYAGSISFFTVSVSLGFMIAMGALVSKYIGSGEQIIAQRYAIYILALIMITCIPMTLGVFVYAPYLLGLLGAEGETLNLAINYLRITVIGIPLMMGAMGLSAILRSIGEAKQAMYTTLSGGVVNGVLDPLFIFTLGLGLEGAAYATLVSRGAMCVVTLYYIQKNQFFRGVHNVTLSEGCAKLGTISLIAIPAILTNLATPVGNAYVTSSISKFGDSAVAGMSMIGRISPVAFAVIFALSGAIGPIIGQNLGAKKYDRIQETVWASMKFSIIYVAIASLLLFFLRDFIVNIFGLTGEARELGILFMTFLSWLFIFQAMGFVANAVFNNTGYAKNSTIINIAKSTIFTMPFVYYGAEYYGASGVLIGQSIGAIFIGIIAFIWCLYSVGNMQKK